jgi:hypothetical protein
MESDLTEVYKLAEAYNSMLMFRDTSTCRMWVAEGCDVRKDILPVMKQLMVKNQKIATFSYFTSAIHRARDERLAREKAEAPPPPMDDRVKAERIAYITRKLGRRMPTEERWLGDYEAKNGPV